MSMTSTELKNVAASEFVLLFPERENEQEALKQILLGQPGCNLSNRVRHDLSTLEQINEVALKIINNTEPSTLQDEMALVDDLPRNLNVAIEGEKARLADKFGILGFLLGKIAAVYSSVFGVIGQTKKIIKSIEAIPAKLHAPESNLQAVLANHIEGKLDLETDIDSQLGNEPQEYEEL